MQHVVSRAYRSLALPFPLDASRFELRGLRPSPTGAGERSTGIIMRFKGDSARRSCDGARLRGKLDQLGAVATAELPADAADVGSCGQRGDHERIGYLLVGKALSD